MGQNVWSLKLVERLVCGAGDDDGRGELRVFWGDLVDTALCKEKVNESNSGDVDGEPEEESDRREESDDLDVQRSSGEKDDEIDGQGKGEGIDGFHKEDDDTPGWRRWKGPWIPKPIGMV